MSSRTQSNFRRGMTFCGWILLVSVFAFPQTPSETVQKASRGFYTASQANDGKRLYSSYCAACHGEDLRGSTAPTLAGPTFVDRWTAPNQATAPGAVPNRSWNATLDDLLFVMQTTMPLGNVKSTSPDEQVAIFAYILQQNGYPAGSVPLRADSPQLKTTRIQSQVPNPTATAAPAPVFIPGEAKSIPVGLGPTQAELNSAHHSSQDWLYHTHDYSGSRFVQLGQIDSSNARQ